MDRPAGSRATARSVVSTTCESDTDLGVTFASTLTLPLGRRRHRRDDAIDPRRLLVNADTPYSFVTSQPGDRRGPARQRPALSLLRGQTDVPGPAPCWTSRPSRWGCVRRRIQRFTDSTQHPALAAAPSAGRRSVIRPAGRRAGRVGWRSPAASAPPGRGHLRRAGFVSTSPCSGPRARRGHRQRDGGRGDPWPRGRRRQRYFDRPGQPVRADPPPGLTRVHLGHLRLPAPVDGCLPEPPDESCELRRSHTAPSRERDDFLADQGRCQATGGVAGGGKLAWLPNHDYELALKVRTTVDYQGSAQEAVVTHGPASGPVGCRDSTPSRAPGTELEPYVESIYPGATRAALSRRADRAGLRRAVQLAAAGRPHARPRRPGGADPATRVGARSRPGRR